MFFFAKAEEDPARAFDHKFHFPAWYLENNIRLRKLERMLKNFLAFDGDIKSSVIKAFKECCDVKSLFNAKEPVNKIPTAKDFDAATTSFLNELFVEYLYEQQLSDSGSTWSKKLGKSLNHHYKDFKEAHNEEDHYALCAFCGIEPIKMLTSEGRPDYDHLLPKGEGLYVFSAVNLANLIAAGDICNKKKSTKNLLYSDNLRTERTISFYPFEDPPPNAFEMYQINLSSLELPSTANNWRGDWEIDIVPNDPEDESVIEKIKNWDRVYNIKARYKEYIMDNGKSIIDKVVKSINADNELEHEVAKDLQVLLDKVYVYEFLFISTESGLIPKRIFIKWALDEKKFLLSYLQTKKNFPAKIDMSLVE